MLLIATPVSTSPPTIGNRMRIFALVNVLKENKLPFHIVYIPIDGMDPAEMYAQWGKENVTVIPWKYPRYAIAKLRVKSFLQKLGFSGRNLMNQGLDDLKSVKAKDKWRQIVNRVSPKVILVEYVYLSWLFAGIDRSIYKVIDTHDVFTDRNWKTERQGFDSKWISFTKRAEKRGLERADSIIAIQSGEALHFKKNVSPNKKVEVVGHLVAPPFEFTIPAKSTRIGYLSSSNGNNIAALKWFLENVWIELYNQNSKLELWVAGSICNVFDMPLSNVYYKGLIEDVSLFYMNCSFTINPMFAGTGLKIKTLESLAHGRAVVTTSVGADGLDEFRNQSLFICDDPVSFIRQINFLAQSIKECQNASTAAFETASIYYKSNKKRFLDIIGV